MDAPTLQRPFQIAAIMEGFTTRKDGGIGIRFSTQEVGPTDILVVHQYRGQFGFLGFKPNEWSGDDMDGLEASIVPDGKTPSQRLRNTLYVKWKQAVERGNADLTFEVFYLRKMEMIIEQIKATLDK